MLARQKLTVMAVRCRPVTAADSPRMRWKKSERTSSPPKKAAA
jgi:hypothetical protein